MPTTPTLQNVIGATLLLAAAVVVGALTAVHSKFRAEPLDPDTLCPIEAPVTRDVALMVDRTDPLEPDHARTLRAVVNEITAELPVNGRLSVHLITETAADAGVPALDRCNPGDGSAIDPLWGNPRRAQARFDAGFRDPLATLVEGLLEAATAPQSPIIEAIAVTAAGLDARAQGRHIVVVSDLLQHTAELSHYRGRLDLDRVRASTAGRMLADGRLNGVEVHLVPLVNRVSLHRQTPDLVPFWEDLLRTAGATVVSAGAAQLPQRLE